MNDRHGKPAPGSREAGEQGCICAVIDNEHGRGYHWVPDDPNPPKFVITGGCPLHWADWVASHEPHRTAVTS